MQNLINKHISNGFAEFEGLNITGSIPVKQELINELIAEISQNGIRSTPQSQPNSSSSPKPDIDINDLFRLIKRAEVRIYEGRIILDFEISV